MLFAIKFVSYCKGPCYCRFFFDYKKEHRFLLYSVCLFTQKKMEVEFLSLGIRYFFLISHLTLSIVCICVYVYFTIYVVSFFSEKQKKKKHILSYNDCFVQSECLMFD